MLDGGEAEFESDSDANVVKSSEFDTTLSLSHTHTHSHCVLFSLTSLHVISAHHLHLLSLTISMAVVPICYKMSYKDQPLLNSKEDRYNEKGFMCSFTATQEDCGCFLQFLSLDTYFGKLQHDANKPSSVSLNKKEEFIDQDGQSKSGVLGSLDDYFGKVSKDANSKNSVSSASNDETSEAASYSVRVGSGRGGWKKMKNYMRFKNKDGEDGSKHSYNETSDFHLISFSVKIASPIQNSDLELFSLPLLYGAKINHLILLGEWWRLVTPMFLHSGILHVALGCWVLLSFGPRVCRAYGSFTFLLIYILGGISGNLTSFLQTPDPTVGGTGPVFAVIGAWLIYQIQNKEVITKMILKTCFRKQ
ncbi:hypothetical protein LOK49_LG02G03599 [Camellia lanceoleosa]|uniref:Uncharacterized protein n=1 Tax=Camellia lanceoleosa TaxID=1840588 RepID=A0ACC0IL30_9ERIC|nr:hypothetical protein LOK49_LG02G03599 [Camellia lanceoleosa]